MSVYKAGHVGGINVSGVTAQGQWFIVSEDLLCKYRVKYPPTIMQNPKVLGIDMFTGFTVFFIEIFLNR